MDEKRNHQTKKLDEKVNGRRLLEEHGGKGGATSGGLGARGAGGKLSLGRGAVSPWGKAWLGTP